MWLKSLLDLFFPPRCEVCKKPGEEALCPICFDQIRFMKPQLGIYSAAAYEGVIKTSLHRFKFQRRKNLAEPLGILLVRYLSQALDFKMKEIEGIVPVPLHPRRLRERGFNQVELIARVIGRYFERPVIAALERIKNTHPQFDLPPERRRENIKGAFRVADCRPVYNRKLLLLDDIYTTGSTAAECCKILKIAGAKQVEILTLARAVEI
jgi:ComF family protein